MTTDATTTTSSPRCGRCCRRASEANRPVVGHRWLGVHRLAASSTRSSLPATPCGCSIRTHRTATTSTGARSTCSTSTASPRQLDRSGAGVPPRRDGRRQRRHRRAGARHRGQHRRHRQRPRGGPPGRCRTGHPGQHGVGVPAPTAASGSTRRACFDPDTDRHLYVSTKVAAELACRDYLNLYQRPFTVLRSASRTARGCARPRVLASFFRGALAGETLRIDGDGRQERNFVYVEDLAQAHREGAASRRPRTARINLERRRAGVDPAHRRADPGAGAGVRWSSSGRRGPATSGPRVVISERAGELLEPGRPRRRHRRTRRSSTAHLPSRYVEAPRR